MNVVHLTTAINTIMKILDIITEAPAPPPTDPDAYLKWWFENKPAGTAAIKLPKEGMLSALQAEYMLYEPYYKAKYGVMYSVFTAAGIIIPILQYHDAMVKLNDRLKKDPSKEAEVLKERQLLAGWLVTSIIVPRLTMALSAGLLTKTLSVWFEHVASTGGRAGARAKAIIGLGSTVIAGIASVIMMTPTGQKWMMDGFLLPLAIYGIGYPVTAAMDYIYSLLPARMRQDIDKALGTSELQTAIEKEKKAKTELDLAAPGWEDERDRDIQQRDQRMRKFIQDTPKDY